MEMTPPWKSQNDFHRRLEISRKREIPTFPQLIIGLGNEKRSNALKTGAKVLPMYPV